MRISTAALFQSGIDGILRNQARLAATQQQLASGTRMVSAKDDPVGWARAASLDRQLAELAQYQSNAGIARHRLSLEETALSDATDSLNRIRELALQANSGSQSAESRKNLALEMRNRLEALLAQANADDGEGRYLFGGSADAVAPFSLVGGNASYAGDQSVRVISLSAERSVATGDVGDQVFLNLRSGNGRFAVSAPATNAGSAQLSAARLVDASAYDDGAYQLSFAAGQYEVRDAGNNLVASGVYASGNAIRFRGVELSVNGTPADGDVITLAPSTQRDVFAIVEDLIDLAQTVPADAAGRAQQQTAFLTAFQEIDGALDHLNEVRAGVGIRLAAADDAQAQAEALDVAGQGALSELRDLDYAEASGRLNMELTALQAAQQAYLRVQGLSLFDLLR
jgi:flagellar hook-associated protein 3 FlgL